MQHDPGNTRVRYDSNIGAIAHDNIIMIMLEMLTVHDVTVTKGLHDDARGAA